MEDIKKQYSKICNLLDELIEKRTTTKTKLMALEDRFHLILAAHALGEITDDELEENRNELAQLKQGLNNTRFTIYGLEARQAELIPYLKVVKFDPRGIMKRQLRQPRIDYELKKDKRY